MIVVMEMMILVIDDGGDVDLVLCMRMKACVGREKRIAHHENHNRVKGSAANVLQNTM